MMTQTTQQQFNGADDNARHASALKRLVLHKHLRSVVAVAVVIAALAVAGVWCAQTGTWRIVTPATSYETEVVLKANGTSSLSTASDTPGIVMQILGWAGGWWWYLPATLVFGYLAGAFVMHAQTAEYWISTSHVDTKPPTIEAIEATALRIVREHLDTQAGQAPLRTLFERIQALEDALPELREEILLEAAEVAAELDAGVPDDEDAV